MINVYGLIVFYPLIDSIYYCLSCRRVDASQLVSRVNRVFVATLGNYAESSNLTGSRATDQLTGLMLH